jgi:hypothetical protein
MTVGQGKAERAGKARVRHCAAPVYRCLQVRWRCGTWAVGILLALSCGNPLRGQTSLTLAWNESAGVAVVGYRLYYGTSSRAYTNYIETGTQCSCTVTGVARGTAYYFAATALDIAGNESDYSDEITYQVPVPALTVREVLRPDGLDVLGITGPAGKTYEMLSSPDEQPAVVLGRGTISPDGTLELLLRPKTFDQYPNYRLFEVLVPSKPLLGLTLTPEGTVLLSATGQVGHAYAVLAARSLPTSAWKNLGTIVPDSTGCLTFTDDGATKRPACFYQLQDLTKVEFSPALSN